MPRYRGNLQADGVVHYMVLLGHFECGGSFGLLGFIGFKVRVGLELKEKGIGLTILEHHLREGLP